jgi:hypothetical protein
MKQTASEELVSRYKAKVKKLKAENKQLLQVNKQLDLSKQVAYETSEAEITGQFSRSFLHSLMKLGLLDIETEGEVNVNFNHCKTLRDLIVTLGNLIKFYFQIAF